jgi:tetratricopeptide (TPR) repeat protein
MAMLYKSQRQFAQAADYCHQALEARYETTPPDDPTLLPYYFALASLHLAQSPAEDDGSDANSHLAEAAHFSGLAREVCDKHDLLAHPAAANLLHVAALVDFRKGDLYPARENWYKALQLARDSGQLALQGRCLNYLAEVALQNKSLPEAEEISRQAVEVLDRVAAYPSLHYLALLNRAQILRAQNRKPEAVECLQQAIQLIEAPRASTVGAETERA